MSRILVSVAEGLTGSMVIRNLLTEPLCSRVGSVVAGVTDLKDPNVSKIKDLDAEIQEIDWNRDNMIKAMTGVDAVFFVSDPKKMNEDSVFDDNTKAFIDAAEAAKVKSFLLWSISGCDLEGARHLSRYHAFEKYLDSKTFSHGTCIVRANFYNETLMYYGEMIRKNNIMQLPVSPDARVAPLSLENAGKAAAHILASGSSDAPLGKHTNKRYHITGPERLPVGSFAEAYNRAFDKQVIYKPVPIEQGHADFKSLQNFWKFSDYQIEVLLENWRVISEGHSNFQTEDYTTITGESPMSLEEWYKKMRHMFISVN
ncbi:hypothetical protein HDU85_005846 [Gaertneriomyces sp. JEL0708]|nr:hypothetical protein HDU85_005846 [Gaertneriomyces sp. JEL0708]